jgi:hypothetical protein
MVDRAVASSVGNAVHPVLENAEVAPRETFL